MSDGCLVIVGGARICDSMMGLLLLVRSGFNLAFASVMSLKNSVR